MKRPAPESSDSPEDDELPGVPGFRSWGGVYLFVLIVFVVCVVLLAWLTRAFS